MVDSYKGSSSLSSAPRTTVRRTNRFGARTAVRTFAISRTPIVLELNHSQILRVGYAEQSKPHHTLMLEDGFSCHDDTSKPFSLNQNLTETQWYNVLSPIITRVYDRLMCNPTTRRVVCVLPHLASTNMIKALKQMLWNKGVPAVTVWSNLEILPVAQGWKRGLIVHVSKEETVCVCHSDGHVLPYTYQSVPVGYGQLVAQEEQEGEEETKENNKLQLEWTPHMDDLFLNENNPNSAVTAVLKTMEDCPRDVRHNCVSNIVFAGEGVLLFPDLSRRVIQRVKTILEGNPAPLNLVTTSTASTTEQQENVKIMTLTPVDTKSLAALAPKLQLISTHPHRPDWISWMGASLWAAAWNKYDDEESSIKWTFGPAD
mmetsp:Transcript_39507/g.95557  ORF Transcript_39507/g.95557 Transcript_39507/m.95557 type:complete len:372 (+) Transcript_39507:40-1155(+)|eukprot:CAMPEP_0113628274 /NCGR_PEP_ID=MMETSP0017_2-20120614/14649_1 /TAXON_ID=2856 /ORGANISM="Cylindrotheca closterium" /LENGTH=371 /DNA_ID=CAMNT_0000538571 /DNA_START=37 /DNA_END=1152 /DNA_ORIENTATION=+ /assembly_acc=CAM_ASM_000147